VTRGTEKGHTRGWHWLAGRGGHSKRAISNLQIWPDFGTGEYGRAACYDYQASGASRNELSAPCTCEPRKLLLIFAKTRSGKRREPQERFLPTHTCVVGAYGEVFANNTCILSGHLQAPWCNSTDGCGAVTFRYAQQESGVVGRFWLSERMRHLPSHAPDSGRKAFAAL